MKDPTLGYARTFVRQVEDCLGDALERRVKIVTNAGGLNPAGLADRLREVAKGLGLDPAIAHVEGDDLRPLGLWEGALTANAYLGGFGIAAALTAGADVVVTGRVTDASLVVGAGIAHHCWTHESHDALAGAVVAGHVLECGTQATGGNFSGFRSLPHTGVPLGFPLAELAADGSFVVTKHDGTGGAVTVDTVTAQLVYEIQSTRYLGPDVTTRLDSIRLEQAGPDRVAVSEVRGEAPPEQLKVCVNELGGFRNTMEFVLTGLDIDAKADWVREQVTAATADHPPAEVSWSRTSVPQADADTEEAASCLLRCTVKDPSPDPVGKAFTAAVDRARARVVPRFHPHRPARARDAVRHLPPAVRRPLAGRAHRRPRRRSARRASPTRRCGRPMVRATPRGSGRRRSRHRRTSAPDTCRSARSSTPGQATRAVTPTWGCGSATTTRSCTTLA